MTLDDFFTPLKVGILVLAGIVAGVSMMAVFSGDFRSSADDDKIYYAYLDNVTGLAVRSRVSTAGIPVGSVEKIELVGDRARIKLSIRGDIDLYEGVERDGRQHVNGALVAKRQATLIGDFYIKLTPGQEGRVLESGETIHNVSEALGPEDLFEQFQEIAADIQQITNALANVLGGEEAQDLLMQMMRDMQSMLAMMNEFVEVNSAQIEGLVAEASQITREVGQLTDVSSASMQRILSDAEAIVSDVRYIVGESGGEMQAGLGTMQGTLTRVERTLDSLNYSLQNVEDITEKVNEGEGTVGQLINNPNIAYSTEQILSDGAGFLDQLLSMRLMLDLRSEYHLNSDQMKTVFGVSLNPSEDKYYKVEFIDDFRGSTSVQTERIETTDASAEDPVYQETRTTTTDEFKFSLMLGRSMALNERLRVGGRAGIIESSGGLGAEVGLFEDQPLQVNADLFDFGAAENPRLRTMGQLEMLRYGYLSGGIDDLFNPSRRDFFLGAGVRFDDDDLRALITATGVPDL